MKPILFDKDTTAFDNNGLGVISDAVRCEVTETINGAFELVLDYPICGDMFASFAVNRIIYAPPNAYTEWQPFRIYEIDKSIDGYVTISAEHREYDLNGQICLPNNEHSETPDSVSGLMSYLTAQSAASSQALGVSQFSFSTDINASDNWVIDRPMSIREAMTYAQNLFGGEWEYNNTQCVLRARRGQDRGVRVRYGDNLLSYRRSETDDSYTHIMPYWTDGTNYIYTEPEYILVSATSSAMQKKVIPLDLSGQFETAPEPADLLQAAYRSDEYRHPPALEISETVSFISLSQTLEYQYLVDSDHVELGDDVGVKVPILDVEATARCNRIVFDVLRERNKTSTLGTLAKTLAASLKKATTAANLHIEVYVDISEPTENIKQGDYWIKVDNMTDLNAISVGRYENGEWLLLCKFGSGGGVGEDLGNRNENFNTYTGHQWANRIIDEQYESSDCCHLEGERNTLKNCDYTSVGGARNSGTNDYCSIVHGNDNTFSGGRHIIAGYSNKVRGAGNIVAGYGNEVTGDYNTIAGNKHKVGTYGALICGYEVNTGDSPGACFYAGNGTPQVTMRPNGDVTAKAYNTSGADYAEYFEWADGNPKNEDRRGMLVSLAGDKIRLAHGDEILGVISVSPSVCGNDYELYWRGKYKTDIIGEIELDKNGNPILSDEYEKDREYIPRSQRPEWAKVGLVGQLTVQDNGSCKVGGYVSARDGIGCATFTNTGIRCIKRLDSTHIRVIIK